MKITLEGKEYDTEDMTKDQRALIGDHQALNSIITTLTAEAKVREVCIASLKVQQKSKLDKLFASLRDEDQPELDLEGDTDSDPDT